jgi:signal transduction histidine kinase
VGFDVEGSAPPPGSVGAGSVAGSVAGTGVGLANVRGRVVGHGGRLDVSSRPGRGTDVRVVLPLVRRRQPNPGPVSLS